MSIDYSYEDLERDNYSDLCLDREPSNSPLVVYNLQIFIADPSSFIVPPTLQLVHLGALLSPRHLVVEGSRNSDTSIFFKFSVLSSLETIHLVSVRVRGTSLGETASELGWNLRRVTFDLPGGDDDYFEDLVESMFGDLPLPEPAEVLILVESEDDKTEVHKQLHSVFDDGDLESRKKVLAQVKVEVREHT